MSTSEENEFKTSECTCIKCITMCHRNPCWPTPAEAQKLIDAGYKERLMTDWWEEYPNNTLLLCPASEGFKNGRAPEGPEDFISATYWTKGKCVFLKDNRCELHNLGLKPLEGRVASHEGGKGISDSVREYIVSLWRKEQDKFTFHPY